jgi:hypothetical protein
MLNFPYGFLALSQFIVFRFHYNIYIYIAREIEMNESHQFVIYTDGVNL